MKLKAIAPWFGGKRTMAPEIVAQLGPHRNYLEPFCGSCAVLFAKPEATLETVNDLHNDLVNLARVLANETTASKLYDAANRTLFSETLIREFWEELEVNPCPTEWFDTERAHKYLTVCWAQRNGIAGTIANRGTGFSLAVRFTPNGGSPTVRFRSAVDSIPAWHERLRNVVILNRNAFPILDRMEDAPGLAIYCDPPYHPDTRTGFKGSGGHSRYAHEFEHENPLFGDDHEHLRDALTKFKKARVVVSYYDCPRIREIYNGWTFVSKTRRKNLSNGTSRKKGQTEALEVLILNGPEFEEPKQ